MCTPWIPIRFHDAYVTCMCISVHIYTGMYMYAYNECVFIVISLLLFDVVPEHVVRVENIHRHSLHLHNCVTPGVNAIHKQSTLMPFQITTKNMAHTSCYQACL
jgi:hypothetical protein